MALPPPHEHTYNEDAWITDDTHHWYAATCEHTEEVKAKAPHTWDEGKETTSPKPGVAGVKTFTCTICNATRTETIPALPPQSGDIGFATGYKPGKTYDRDPISINKSNIVRIVDGVHTPITNPDDISFMFKEYGADDSTYKAEAPIKPGHYMVKVTVAASPEWTEKELVQEFNINKIKLTGSLKLAEEKIYNAEIQSYPNLIWGKSVLPCIVEGETVEIINIKSKTKNAGTNYANFELKPSENYYIEDDSLKILVTIKPLEITENIAITKTYDGTFAAIYRDWNTPTILATDVGKLELRVEAAGKNVGSYMCNKNAFYLKNENGIFELTDNYKINNSQITVKVEESQLSFKEDPTRVYDGVNSTVEVTKGNINGLAEGEEITFTIETRDKNVKRPQKGTIVVPDLTYTYSEKDGTKFSNYSIDQSEINRARIIARSLSLNNQPLSSEFFNFGYFNGDTLELELTKNTFDGFLEGDSSRFKLEVSFRSKDIGAGVKSFRIFDKNVATKPTTSNYQFSEEDEGKLKSAVISPKKVIVDKLHCYVLPDSPLSFVLNPSKTYGEFVIAQLGGSILPLQDGTTYKLSELAGQYTFTTNNNKYEAVDISNFSGFTTEIVVKNLTSPNGITKNVECKLRTDDAGYIYGCVSDSKFINGNITVSGSDTPFTLMDLSSGKYIVQYVENNGSFTHIGGGDLYLIVKGTPNTEYTIKVSAT